MVGKPASAGGDSDAGCLPRVPAARFGHGPGARSVRLSDPSGGRRRLSAQRAAPLVAEGNRPAKARRRRPDVCRVAGWNDGRPLLVLSRPAAEHLLLEAERPAAGRGERIQLSDGPEHQRGLSASPAGWRYRCWDSGTCGCVRERPRRPTCWRPSAAWDWLSPSTVRPTGPTWPATSPPICRRCRTPLWAGVGEAVQLLCGASVRPRTRQSAAAPVGLALVLTNISDIQTRLAQMDVFPGYVLAGKI